MTKSEKEYIELYKSIENNNNPLSINDMQIKRLYELNSEIFGDEKKIDERDVYIYENINQLIDNILDKCKKIDYNLAIHKYNTYYEILNNEFILKSKIDYILNQFINSEYDVKFLEDLKLRCDTLKNLSKQFIWELEKIYKLLINALCTTGKKIYANFILESYESHKHIIASNELANKCTFYYAKMTALFAIGDFYGCIDLFNQNLYNKYELELSCIVLDHYENLCIYSYFLALRRITTGDEYKNELIKFKSTLTHEYYFILKLDYAMTCTNPTEEINELLKEVKFVARNYDKKGLVLKKIELFCIKYLNNNDIESINKMYLDIIKKCDFAMLDYELHQYSSIVSNCLSHEEFTTLYHYTNINSLKNILENNMFWVTESTFLNDITETKYILTYIEKIISICSHEENINDNFWSFLNQTYNGLLYYFGIEDKDIDTTIKNNLNELSKTKIYILSLSTEKDSLTLWGNYANNEGYNIGINREALDKYLGNIDICNDIIINETLNGLVQYEALPNESNLDDNKLYKSLYSYYEDAIDSNISNTTIVGEAIASLIYLGIFIKKDSFADEREYRIVFRENNRKESFRIKNNSFLPYIQIPFDKGCITEVNIGPNNNSDISRKGVKRLLDKNQYNSTIKINDSEIPLRY